MGEEGQKQALLLRSSRNTRRGRVRCVGLVTGSRRRDGISALEAAASAG